MSQLHREPADWKTLSSVYMHREPWFTVRKDSVQLENGRIIEDYFVQEFPPWCNVIAVTVKGELLLIRQYRHGIGKVFYELPAGVHDKEGENILEAAKRELREETGYGGGRWRWWMELSANPALQNNITTTFLAEGVEPLGPQALDATEEISICPVSHEQLGQILDKGEILQALHVAPLLKYLMQRGTA
ncbi:MAG: NUDIX hydrolase [Chlorobium sp.]|nr:NUDIX hydrolase [Chlorobium phaeovibrioides]NQU45561.1 NUDIX hydrolase [Chlorobium sp.]